MPVMMIRRASFVALLITIASVRSWILISILSVMQLWYMTYIIILRPYENVKNNIIETLNEIFFSILLIWLIFINSEKDWSFIATQIYMWVIASNSIITFLLTLRKFSILNSLADFFKSMFLIAKAWLRKHDENGNNLIYRIINVKFSFL